MDNTKSKLVHSERNNVVENKGESIGRWHQQVSGMLWRLVNLTLLLLTIRQKYR